MRPLSARCRLENMPAKALVDQYTNVVAWWQCHSNNIERPSEFEMDELRNELVRRLEEAEDED